MNRSPTKDNLETYRFTRVPFGIISSPFLLGASINHHIESTKTKIAEQIVNNIYVDNLISGAKSEEEAKELYLEENF